MGFSWARFRCSWGLVGGSFHAFWGSRWHPEFQNKTSYLGSLEPPSWPPRSLQQPQAAPQAPSCRGRWPHEATKAHLETYLDLFSTDLGPEIKEKKKARGIVTDLSKRLSALVFYYSSSSASSSASSSSCSDSSSASSSSFSCSSSASSSSSSAYSSYSSS